MQNNNKGIGIASLVLGIVSILLSWTVVISIPCAIVGMTLGILYLSKRKQDRGFAIAGLATSGIGMLITILIWVGMFFYTWIGPAIRQEMEQQIPFYEEFDNYQEDDLYEFFDDYFEDDYNNGYFYDGIYDQKEFF